MPAMSARTPAKRFQLCVALVCVVASSWLLAHLIVFPYGRDQAIYALAAQAMLEGGAPYVDIWDFKTPGVYFVFAAAEGLFGRSMSAIRIVEALGFASLLPAFALLSRRLVGSALAGLIGATLAILTHVTRDWWNTAQPEGFGAIAIAWALVLGTEDRDSRPSNAQRRIARWAAAGALYAVAGLMKPPLGLAGLASLAVVAWGRRTRGEAHAVALPAAAYAGGVGLVLSLVALYLIATDSFGAFWYAVFEFAPRYTALGTGGESLAGLLLRSVLQIGNNSWLVPAGLVLALALPPLGPREREGLVHVFAVVAVQLVGVAVQAKFFAYHYGAVLPLLSLIAGWGLWKLATRGRLAAVVTAVAVLALFRGPQTVFWDASPSRMAAVFDSERRAGLDDAWYPEGRDNRRAGEWLRAHTAPGETVYVWGFEPAIYVIAQRRPASRFIYNVPQRAPWSQATRGELMEALTRNDPVAIAVVHGDALSWVTGSDLGSAGALAGFPELQARLARGYLEEARFGNVAVYTRRGSSPGAPPAAHAGESSRSDR